MDRPSLLCLYDMQVSFLPIVKGISSPGTADHQAEVFEKAANMVLEIAPDLDQQRPAGQQCSDRVLLISLTCTSLNQPVQRSIFARFFSVVRFSTFATVSTHTGSRAFDEQSLSCRLYCTKPLEAAIRWTASN